MSRPVMVVEALCLRLDGKLLELEARGLARSGGWQRPRLVLREAQAEAGCLALDFLAEPPQGPATCALTPIAARLALALPEGVGELAVHAETNVLRLPIRDSSL